MACFFRGSNFVRNFYIPPVIRAEFGNQNEGKIYLSPFSSTTRVCAGRGGKRQDLTPSSSFLFFALLLSLFVLLTFNTMPAYASPPTHYINSLGPLDLIYVTGRSPAEVAKGVIANRNAAWGTGGTYEIPQDCRFDIAYVSFPCALVHCSSVGPCVRSDNGVVVLPMCGPQRAVWDGLDLTCPPEPDCDTPAQ